MVVDLGAVTAVSAVELAWTRGPVPETRIETSTDGVTYEPVARGRATTVAVAGPARYVAVRTGRRTGDASLSRLSVRT